MSRYFHRSPHHSRGADLETLISKPENLKAELGTVITVH